MHNSPVSCDTLITASLLVTQDAGRRVIENAAIAVKDGRILALGTRAALAAYAPAEHVELGASLLMPGLVNAHTHSSMTFLRGLADDLPLMDWLQGHIFPVEKHLERDIVRAGCLLGCAEMIRSGTTAFADMYLLENAVAEAVDQCGLKALAGEVIFAFPSPAYSSFEAALELVREQEKRWRGHPRVRVSVMPHAVYTTTPEIMQACHALAEELDIPLYLHLAETKAETLECFAAHGKRPVEYCHSLGILGRRTSIAHGVDVTEAEQELLAATGTKVAHNPKSNMKLASGIAPIPSMLRYGVSVGLGTDGAASNNSLNMFSEMSVCALLHKVAGQDPTLAPAQAVLDMATLGSAAVLGWGGLGRLEPGGPADMVALDLTSPNLQPMYNPVSHLVYAATGHEVRFSMVDGKVLYKDGRFLSLDYPALLREAKELQEWALSKRG